MQGRKCGSPLVDFETQTYIRCIPIFHFVCKIRPAEEWCIRSTTDGRACSFLRNILKTLYGLCAVSP